MSQSLEVTLLRKRKLEEQFLLKLQSGPRLEKNSLTFSMDNILSNWEACMVCGLAKERRLTF